VAAHVVNSVLSRLGIEMANLRPDFGESPHPRQNNKEMNKCMNKNTIKIKP
jgi:hypothetical protein